MGEQNLASAVTDSINTQPMSPAQMGAVLVCVFLVALNGFDVLAIAFSAPGIASEWQLSEGALGWLVTMDLFGMAIGSIFLGNLADRFGRRPVMLTSVLIMSLGMAAAALATNVQLLSGFRILTGIGIGAVLASANALVAELANNRHRNSLVILMAGGSSLGAAIGGLIATQLLEKYGWRSVFYLGATGTTIAIPLILLFLPESISFLATQRPPGALAKINEILRRFKKAPLPVLPPLQEDAKAIGFNKLLGPKYFKATLLLSLAYVAHISTYYFMLKWVPKLVTDMGFSESLGGRVLVWLNLGGLAGFLVLALAMQVLDARRLAITAVFSAAVVVGLYGQISTDLTMLTLASICAGFFSNAAAGAMFPLMANYFSAEVRASGSGVVLGVGRVGAIAGPLLAGYLLQAQYPLSQVTFIIALGSAMAGLAIFLLDSSPRR